MDPNAPPVLGSRKTNRLVAAGPVGRPNFNVPTPITQTFREIRVVPRADDFVGMEELVENRNAGGF